MTVSKSHSDPFDPAAVEPGDRVYRIQSDAPGTYRHQILTIISVDGERFVAETEDGERVEIGQGEIFGWAAGNVDYSDTFEPPRETSA